MTFLATQVSHPDVLDRFSCLNRLLRALVRCRCLILRRRHSATPAPLSLITAAELRHAFITCVLQVSAATMPSSLKRLHEDDQCILPLAPLVDDEGILRVGGRLEHSNLPFDEKHPVILDSRDPQVRLLIDWAHMGALHGGYRLTHSYVMRRAWLVSGRARIKSRLRQCVICAKTLARPSTQIMAPLPAPRVTASPSFSCCGVGYAGPFQVLRSKGRGLHSSKGYVAAFICLNAKAIHLELVGDLTTARFLGALTRFIGRRGMPVEIWSDNATNFKGADAEHRCLMHEASLDWNTVSTSAPH